jgi:hypothetical protein
MPLMDFFRNILATNFFRLDRVSHFSKINLRYWFSIMPGLYLSRRALSVAQMCYRQRLFDEGSSEVENEVRAEKSLGAARIIQIPFTLSPQIASIKAN